MLNQLEISQWIALMVVAFVIGISKTGLTGIITLVIPILAEIFGGMASTGILLPMLIVGDILGLFYYRQSAEKKDILNLLPWAYMGVGLGLVLGNQINDYEFKILIAISVLIGLAILVYFEVKKGKVHLPSGWWFYALTGILCGFTSMIGNAAGPIFSVYLLAKGVDKAKYLGITAWFFFIVNVSKVPLQIFFWKNITNETLLIALYMTPLIIIGGILGAIIVKKMNENLFRKLMIALTFVASLKLFF
ncbi:MAG: sulfite exporter TauE/SafE family protein [Clostridiaceae bacterium]|nr:sulfite exporter TauE/SafE family protein [Clostridiaceae bacterium]